MKKKFFLLVFLCFSVAVLLPLSGHAQSFGQSIYSLHHVMEDLFDEMMPLCSGLINVGRSIAGFAALWFIGYRVWGHIARAEPVDFYPLLRPFALGMAIMMFPLLVTMMNGVLEPVSDATAAMAQDSNKAIEYYLDQQEKQVMEQPETAGAATSGSPDQWAQYEEPEDSGKSGGFLGNAFSFFKVKEMFISAIKSLLEILYAAAGLAIDTIRTFYLIVLVIIGPLVFGLSAFDGFQHTLSHWISRYVHVWMWLPVANIFGAISSKILELMTVDGNVNTFAYLIFMVISIVGYTTVPSVAGYIIQAGGGGRDTLLHKANKMVPVIGGKI